MPFPAYHFGAVSFFGLCLKRWLDIPVRIHLRPELAQAGEEQDRKGHGDTAGEHELPLIAITEPE